MREIVIRENDANQRLDKFLTKALSDIPKSLIYKSIRTKKIKVNRKRATPEQMLAAGDTLQLFISEEFFKSTENDGTAALLSKVNYELKIVYEDDNLLLVNKEVGVSVHEDETNQRNNLITFALAYLYKKGDYAPLDEQSFTPALCNRLDRNTAGIVIIAKNAQALRDMNRRIKERKISKFYLCAVHGTPARKSDTLTAYHIKNEKTKLVKIYDKYVSGAKKIITKYRVMTSSSKLSLIEVELITGRTHQIRAHMAHIGHPLLGDGKYGINKSDRELGYKYQALASYKLTFPTDCEQDSLSYLSGKSFEIPMEELDFIKFFK